ncbi:MAG TPA: cytochrome c3 family protein [Terriglobia bacterium]|nr:cytochrome c3 family protein [Terriglobia bacterium]
MGTVIRIRIAGLAAVVFLAAVWAPTQSSSNPPSAPRHYVGSIACRQCHAAIYARWDKTPMAHVVRDPKQYPDAILADFSRPTSAVTFTRNDISLVYGSIWKQRYFKKVGGSYYVLPAQWDIAHHQWLPYFVKDDWWAPFYPPDNMRRPTAPLCDGCHSVHFDVRTQTPTEWNVGCERCHGPGSVHVEHPLPGTIVNPARLDSVAANDVCIQCHSQGRPLQNPIGSQYYDWPAGFEVGLHLADFWKLEVSRAGQADFYFYPDGTAHKNRMQGNDFVHSLMYRRGVTCFSCHDAHGTENEAQLLKPAAVLCLECHKPGSPLGPFTRSIEEHTQHAAGSPGSECVACHMPEIETEGVPGAFVHAHTFRFITPSQTERENIPNPCTLCHQDKSPSWATEALKRWPGRSPWRME